MVLDRTLFKTKINFFQVHPLCLEQCKLILSQCRSSPQLVNNANIPLDITVRECLKRSRNSTITLVSLTSAILSLHKCENLLEMSNAVSVQFCCEFWVEDAI